MKMDRFSQHPDDERLAAFAGADLEATSDHELADHVAACSRCTEIVDELAALRASLAELPDLVPPRRLRLLPPVAEPRLTFVQRLAGISQRAFAPLLAAGAGLVLVGAVGGIGSLGAGMAAAPAAQRGAAADLGEPTPATESDEYPAALGERSPEFETYGGASPAATDRERGLAGAPTPSVAPPDEEAAQARLAAEPAPPPWMGLFLAGVALIGVAFVLRLGLASRATR